MKYVVVYFYFKVNRQNVELMVLFIINGNKRQYQVENRNCRDVFTFMTNSESDLEHQPTSHRPLTFSWDCLIMLLQ